MSTPSILIIDDDPNFVVLTRTSPDIKQYKVRFAYNPNEGYAKLEEETPPTTK